MIVGKRALPAIGLAHEGGPLAAQVDLIARARRHRDRVRRGDDGDRAVARRSRAGGAASRSPSRTPGRNGSSSRRATTRSCARSWSRPLYHVLWELVHVFFDHRGLLAGRTPGRSTTPARRASCIRSWASARPISRRVLEDVRGVGADEGGGGRRAAEPDAHRCARGAARPRPRRCARRSRRAGSCWRSATAARRPTRWTWWPTSATPPARLAGASGDRPHRGPRDPHRDRQRHRRRGDLPAPGDRLRPRRRRAAGPLHQRQLAERDRGAGRGAPARHAHDRAGRATTAAGSPPRGSPTT